MPGRGRGAARGVLHCKMPCGLQGFTFVLFHLFVLTYVYVVVFLCYFAYVFHFLQAERRAESTSLPKTT